MTLKHTSRFARGGFTLIEMLMSIMILGILISLLFVAYRHSRTFAAGVVGRAAVADVRMAVTKFETEFGFPPPLVRDQAINQPGSVKPASGGGAQFAVYNFSLDASTNTVDLPALNLMPVPTTDNPFKDKRFSERSIPYYLAGACETERNPGDPDPVGMTLPIDGVPGPGFYKPRNDGTFEVPKSIRDGSGAESKRAGGAKFESFIDFTKRALSTKTIDPDSVPAPVPAVEPAIGGTDGNKRRAVELRDAKGLPIRYYRWINGDPTMGYKVNKIDDLHLPPLVGRKGSNTTLYGVTPIDRDIEKNAALRSAKFAIVAAGPDGAFGDEDIPVLEARLHMTLTALTPEQLAKVRRDAERDNIVEVGD